MAQRVIDFRWNEEARQREGRVNGGPWKQTWDDPSIMGGGAPGGPPPEVASGFDPNAKGYWDQLQGLMAQQPGQGWETSPYYRALLGEIQKDFRGRYQRAGADAARSGVVSPGMVGATARAATEREYLTDLARTQAGSQAYQAHVGYQQQQIDNAFKAIGIAQGVADAQWEQKFRVWATRVGISQAEQDRQVALISGILNTVGNVGALAYAAGRP